MEIFAIVLFIIAAIFIVQSVKVVPQQNAWVVERLGKYFTTLSPGLSFLVTPGDPADGHEVRAQSTSQFLARYDLQLAINGDFFWPWWYYTIFKAHTPALHRLKRCLENRRIRYSKAGKHFPLDI